MIEKIKKEIYELKSLLPEEKTFDNFEKEFNKLNVIKILDKYKDQEEDMKSTIKELNELIMRGTEQEILDYKLGMNAVENFYKLGDE